MLEELIEKINSFSKRSLPDYSNLETTVGERTFVFRTQTMASVISYGGVRHIVGAQEFAHIVDQLTDTLNPFMGKGAHEVQFVLNRDLMTQDRMRKRMAPMYESAKKMGFDEAMNDIFDEQAQYMAEKTMDDTIVMVLYTHPSALRDEDYKEWLQTLREERQKGSVHVAKGTQDETYAIDPLVALHDAFVDQVVGALTSREIGALCKTLKIGEATNLISRFIDPLGTSDKWQAWLLPTSDLHLARKLRDQAFTAEPSKAIKAANPKVVRIANTALAFPPPLTEQLLRQEGRYAEDSFFEYGGRRYATLTMTVPPKKLAQASQLISSLSNMQTRSAGETFRVPYRLSMRMRGNGLKLISQRAMWAPLFSVGSVKNQKLMRAAKALQEEKNADLAVCSFSLSITTWVDATEVNATQVLKGRVVAMRSAASQWGDMQVVEETIDRAQAFVASCPSLTLDPCSPEGVGSLKDLLPLFPFGRPASPLGDEGVELYRSMDGAILPTEAHSTHQDYWLETITSPMGGGKSVAANRKHLDFCFAPGRTNLPFLHALDIGGSISGLVSLLRDSLPEDKKELAYMHTLRNSREHAVNMLDPKVGLREPLARDMDVIVDWLTALVTPAERVKPYDNMSEFCRVVLKATYRRYHDSLDSSQPRLYKPGHADIDNALAEARIDIKPSTPWYQVSDQLGARGFFRAAILAHRKAVPLLTDVHVIASEDNIRSDFMKAMTEQGVPIPDAFVTQLGLARESFPIFTEETVLDLRGRRVTAIDLGEVAPKGSAAARKQASLMYMVAYELFARNIRLTDEDLVHFGKPWQPYYQKLHEDLKNTHKHITIDEYHRTMLSDLLANDDPKVHDSQGVRATLVREGGRESRKWGLSLTTISQESADHGQLLSLASANHVLKRGSAEETKFQAQALGLRQSDLHALQVVNGPRRGEGVTFMSQWITTDGRFTQLFNSLIGPKTLWSLSSTFEDKEVRRMVFEALGRSAGRSVLAKHYPSGSARDEVERRKKDTSDAGSGEDVAAAACMAVANEMIAQYRSNPMNYQ